MSTLSGSVRKAEGPVQVLCTGGSGVLQQGPPASALGHLELRKVVFCVATVVAVRGLLVGLGVFVHICLV